MSYIDQQNRAPRVEYLPDTRLRITREYTLIDYADKSPSLLAANVFLTWGAADSIFTNCRLIKQDVSGQIGQGDDSPTKDSPTLIRVYEQIPALGEQQVGNPGTSFDQSGVKSIDISYVQFSAGTTTFQVPGVSVCPAPNTDCVLKTEERTDDGTLQRIRRVYVNSGLLNQTDEIKNNGSLLIRTLTYIKQVPPTPSGYVLFNKKIDYPNGLPVYTYSFAQGNGQISSQTEYRRSVDSGATGVTVVTIKYLSASSVSSNPITPPGGYSTLQTGFDDQDGYRIWTGQYAIGTGTVESSKDIKNNGKLIIYSITALDAPPSTPSATIGGTVVLIRSAQRNSPRLEEGAIVYDYVWAEGNGLVEDNIESLPDGLRDETYISLGTQLSPSSGIVIKNIIEQIDGVTKYTVTARQSSSGGAPTGETFSFQRYCPFTYPGRLKTYISTGSGGQRFLDVFKSPPIQTDVLSTVIISYQTSNTIPSLPATLWQPLDGATISGQWVGFNNIAANVVESWRDYRAISSTPISITSRGTAPNDSIFGNLAYGSTVAVAQVDGGPPDPSGSTWTILPPTLEFAFQDISGTKYYRLTIVTAAIPSQPALPV